MSPVDYFFTETPRVRYISDTLYRIRHDTTSPRWGYKPREIPGLNGPPEVNPAFANTSEDHGSHRTNMSLYGWEEYMRFLNPGKQFDIAVDRTLAMFNGAGWPKMESLFFGGNLVRAIPADKPGWMQIVTMNYADGPDYHFSYDEAPGLVQKFTIIWRDGHISSRDLYYPIVCAKPIYMPEAWLERVSADMETIPPP